MAHPQADVALALLESGRPRAALAVASRALADGEDAGLRLCRARALLAFRAVHEAERDLVRCLKLAPRTGAAFQLLCELALGRGDLAAAEVFLRDAARFAPKDFRAAELGRVVRGWRKAAEMAREAASATPSTIDRSAA